MSEIQALTARVQDLTGKVDFWITSQRHWFWSGAGELETEITNWRARLQRFFKLAKTTDGHAHRFRDTCSAMFNGFTPLVGSKVSVY
jgi:hypothetical protein